MSWPFCLPLNLEIDKFPQEIVEHLRKAFAEYDSQLFNALDWPYNVVRSWHRSIDKNKILLGCFYMEREFIGSPITENFNKVSRDAVNLIGGLINVGYEYQGEAGSVQSIDMIRKSFEIVY